ncbi:hypothetical protein E3E12_08485 [Formicincola oecophyllae]|uniref:Right-handed parallel beta-helix repeat-containing protein n=1 Tax=Formicincola oecophyllae TaxID=2558361 RepID=A0A4Y6UCQ1_9PROT|nr:hypothetical protein [Formicincola oecophyllae]QDH14217.1 hypothetical protein E3E12_08485 [Formicincola oecophyllae]
MKTTKTPFPSTNATSAWAWFTSAARTHRKRAATLLALGALMLPGALPSAARAGDRTVCPTGCAFSSPLAAFRDALGDPALAQGVITIHIQDGTYPVNDQFYVDNPWGGNIHLVGNTDHPERVVLVFNNIAGTNFNGFFATDGGRIGLIDGMTINGSGAQSAHSASGTSWRLQSYGGGITARYGGKIVVGPHVSVNHFYYSLMADQGGIINAPSGHVTGTDAGDVNFFARHNGVLHCENCTADRAVDTTGGPVLGCNFMAEEGGSLTVNGSVGSNGRVGGLCILTASHAWGHDLHLLGGLPDDNGQPQGWGLWATENGYAETYGSHVEGYQKGVYVNDGAGLDLSNDVIANNVLAGVVADGGHVDGSHVTSTNNGGLGYQAFHQGRILVYDSRALSVGNKGGLAGAEQASDGNMQDDTYTASTVVVE